MNAKIFALLFFLSLAHTPTQAHTTEKNQKPDNTTHYWMRFKAKDKYERSKVADIGFEIESIVDDSVYGIGSAEDLENAKKSGLLETYLTLDATTTDFPPIDSDFHTYNELTQAIQKLAQENPGLVQVTSIGLSLEGREIPLLTITSDGADTSKPAVIFMGGHHAREHMSVETPLNLAKYLAQEFKSNNARIVDLLKSRTVYIVPLVNPDGAEYDVATGSYKLWRKNRKNNGGSYGVDLNRNYGFGWGGGGASPTPGSDVYRGPQAFSEPETQAIKNFIESHDNISIVLSFHSYSQLILYPWGHTYDSIQNQADYKVHKKMAETMAVWNGYTPQQSSDLYIASGDTTDWTYGQLGLISFTFELDPTGNGVPPNRGFYPGQSQILPIFQKNLEPCLYLIDFADNPYRATQSSSQIYGFSTPILE